MKKASIARRFLLGSVFFVLLSSADDGLADTLHFNSSAGTVAGGNTIYPYYFNINGSSALTSLMCVNYNREIMLGETWNVTIDSLPMDSSAAAIGYRADAWIYSQLGKYSTADVQYAVWDIFDPGDVAHNTAFDSQAQQLVTTGMQMAQNTALINSGFFSNYQIYIPTTDQTGWTDGQPQTFIGSSAVTPEPSQLLLMGTGFVGVFFLYRRSSFSS